MIDVQEKIDRMIGTNQVDTVQPLRDNGMLNEE